MKKQASILFITALLAGQAHASAIGAIAEVLARVFKGGAVAKEATVAGRTAEGAVAAKGIEHVPAGEFSAKLGAASSIPEPKPNIALDPVGKSKKDLDTYKALRSKAQSGDTESMLKMSEMTASGKVSDPGEPFHAYWLINATRVGSQAASKKLQGECASKESMRNTDKWFDLACYNIDHRTLYSGDKLPGAYTTLRTAPAYQLK